ncbi:VOC family protein [Streptomyces sp. NPDC042319]|uniref:VOC family protein n=1 Tax=Streptomyces sp. NPDC042319 TaxID=3154332 RepID=UPI0033C36EE3
MANGAGHYVPPALGAPCRVSLAARDLPATEDFYAAVLGWSFRPSSFGDGFRIALCDGKPVAGIGPLAGRWQMTVVWTPYFAVPHADETAARIRERGATVAIGPLALGHGRAAHAADRDGAAFGIWEGQTLVCSVGQEDAPAHLELRTRDIFDSAVFYAEVFGWAAGHRACYVAYEEGRVVVRQDGHTVAALHGGGIEAAPDPKVRPRWHVHFHVKDAEAVSAAALAAGGAVSLGASASDAPAAHAVIRDPDGGLFTVPRHRASGSGARRGQRHDLDMCCQLADRSAPHVFAFGIAMR